MTEEMQKIYEALTEAFEGRKFADLRIKLLDMEPADIANYMEEELDEKEQALVKRARNRKSATKAKNADPVTYKWATAFEALTGYLYLTENQDRLSWLMERAIGIVKDEHINGRKETKEKAAGQK